MPVHLRILPVVPRYPGAPGSPALLADTFATVARSRREAFQVRGPHLQSQRKREPGDPGIFSGTVSTRPVPSLRNGAGPFARSVAGNYRKVSAGRPPIRGR